LAGSWSSWTSEKLTLGLLKQEITEEMEPMTSSGMFTWAVGIVVSIVLNLSLGACTAIGTDSIPSTATTAGDGSIGATGQMLPEQQSSIAPTDEVTASATITLLPLMTSTPHVADIPSDLSDLEIYMEKTACEGPCPVYSVRVEGDGTVVYNGKTCVNVVGEQTDQISQEKVRDLVESFYQNDFFSLEDAYVEDVEDIPAILIRITLRDQTKQVVKRVYDESKAPIELERIEDSIDTIANTQQWVMVNGTTILCP
jgi:hypothetical protein